MRPLALSLALWFLGNAPPLSHAEALECRCHAKGFPRCDCGEGCACRCVILESGTPLPVAAQFALALIPKTFAGAYESRTSPIAVIVTPLRPGHYAVTWYYSHRPTYTGTLQRTGPFTAIESWHLLVVESGPIKGQGNWIVVGKDAWLSPQYQAVRVP